MARTRPRLSWGNLYPEGADVSLPRLPTDKRLQYADPSLNMSSSNGFGFLDNLGWDLGTAANTPSNPQPVANSANVDGASGFLNQISGLGNALLSSMGAPTERVSDPMVHQAAWGRQEQAMMGGLDVKTIALVGLAGFAIYYATTR